MKKLILLVVLLGALPAVSHAKTVVAPQKMKALKWPKFSQAAPRESMPAVRAIQLLLRSRDFYKGPEDGVFGAQTAKSVRAFQRKNGLKADGIVASQTFSKLVKTVKRGDKGDAVRAMQVILKYSFVESETFKMPPLEVDGVFGFKTEQALRAFQEDYGLKLTDNVGVQTWAYLFDGDSNSDLYQ